MLITTQWLNKGSWILVCFNWHYSLHLKQQLDQSTSMATTSSSDFSCCSWQAKPYVILHLPWMSYQSCVWHLGNYLFCFCFFKLTSCGLSTTNYTRGLTVAKTPTITSFQTDAPANTFFFSPMPVSTQTCSNILSSRSTVKNVAM